VGVFGLLSRRCFPFYDVFVCLNIASDEWLESYSIGKGAIVGRRYSKNFRVCEPRTISLR